MKRRNSHQANDSRTIRVRDNRTLPQLNIPHCIRINFRNHQRHILIHPKSRAIIHHNGPTFRGNWPQFLTNTPTGTEQRDVDAGEGVLGELFHDVFDALEGEFFAGGALGGEHFDGGVREVAVGEDGEEFLADGAGDADDGDGGGVFLE